MTMLHQSQQQKPDREKIPRALLLAMAMLALSSLLLVTYAQIAGVPDIARPMDLPVAQERLLILSPVREGPVMVTDAETGAVIANSREGSNGFIETVARVLERQRMLSKADAAAPLRLVEFEGGRMALLDTVTDWHMELTGYGADNIAAFAQLLN
jgi:putative photosynthetic complex assembly protein